MGNFGLLPSAGTVNDTNQSGWGQTGDQGNALGLASLAARGLAPSAAQYQMQAGIQQAQAAAGAQAASTRGSLGLAGAQRAAMGTQAGLAQNAVNAAAQLRAKEQADALSTYGGLAGQARSQDLQGSQLALQQATTNAQLAQQQQLANQGVSGQLAGAAVGTAMKALPAIAAFSDANAKTELTYGDMPLGAPRDRNITTSDPLKRPDVAARRQQLQQQLHDLDVYESQQHPQLPAPQVNAYHDANLTEAPRSGRGLAATSAVMDHDTDEGYVAHPGDPSMAARDPAKVPQAGPPGVREPIVASRGSFAERVPPHPGATDPIVYDYVNPNPNTTRDWQERPFRPESGAPIRFADISPEESRALGASQAGAPPPGQYHDMPVATSVLSEPSGGPPGQGAEWTLREERKGPGHKSFIAAVDHQDHEVGKVRIDPLTPSEQKQVAEPHGAGPLPGLHGDMAMGAGAMAPAMKHRYGDANLGETASQIGDIWSNFGKAAPAQKQDASGGAPAAKPEEQPDHEPIGNVASYQNADNTWTKDATPTEGAPAPGSALARMSGPGNAWTDDELRRAQGPGGFAQPYSPQSGAASDYPWASGNGRFSGPSEAAEGPVGWKAPSNLTNPPNEPAGYKPGGLASLNYGPPTSDPKYGPKWESPDLVAAAKQHGIAGQAFGKDTSGSDVALIGTPYEGFRGGTGGGTPESVYNKYAKPVDTTPSSDDSFLYHDETIGGAFDAAQKRVDAARENYRASQVASRQAAADKPLLKPHAGAEPSVSYHTSPGSSRALESLVGPSGAPTVHQGNPNRLTDPAFSDERAKQLEGQHTGFAAASDFMRTLQPHAFTWKDPSVAPNPSAAAGKNVGVFAQEVARTPYGKSIVQRDPGTGYLTMDKNALVGALAASAGALKQQQDDHALRIQELERALGTRR